MARIVALLSNPDDHVKLRSDREVKEINKMISSKTVDDVHCSVYQAITVQELPSILLNNKPDILHFSGHGDTNHLLFENKDGEIQRIELNALKSIFEECGDGIICVFLSACKGHKIADAMSEIMPYVVYFPEDIEDDQAIAFSTLFYEMLVMRKTFQSSFKIAEAIISNGFEDSERLPKLRVNKSLKNYRETLYNPPVIVARFKEANEDNELEPERRGNIDFILDINNLPESATQVTYEFADVTVIEEYRFNRLENLTSGSSCDFSVYGNIVIRAWIWIENQKRGFAISSSLTNALNNYYHFQIPKRFKKLYEHINTH